VTFTSTKIAVALHKYIKSKKPISMIDTETGSDFMIPIYKREKIEFLVAKTRAFKDMLEIIDEAEKSCEILIIDSITHIWNEMTECYCKKHRIPRVTINHWEPVKRTWREFTRRFCNSKLHFIIAGRSADKWEETIDADNIKEVKKVGTKMRCETEISYEPSLLVELSQVHKNPQTGSGWIHRAWVIKDRWNEETHLEGKSFDNPTFECFLPHIKLLNLGGKHRAIDEERNSSEMFENKNDGHAKFQEKKTLLEEIQNYIRLLYPGETKEEKTARIKILMKYAGTNSWNAVTDMSNEQLKAIKQAFQEIYEKEKAE